LGVQLPVQSVPITIKVVSSNPAHGEVYLIMPKYLMFWVNKYANNRLLFLRTAKVNQSND